MTNRYKSMVMENIFSDRAKINYLVKVGVAIMTETEGFTMAERRKLDQWLSLSGYHLMTKIRDRSQAIEKHTGHDVASFVLAMKEFLPGWCRDRFHRRSTSSDLVDIVLALQLEEAFSGVRNLVDNLKRAYLRRKKIEKSFRFNGRTHGRVALPITGAERWGRLVQDLELVNIPKLMRVHGKLGGPVGNDYTKREVQKVSQALGVDLFTGNARQCAPRHQLVVHMRKLVDIAGVLENHATYLRLLLIEGVEEYRIKRSGEYIGSSSMVWKNNPTELERVCGMARIVRGLGSALDESTNLWHERDISHSSVERVAIPQMFNYVTQQLSDLTDVVNRLDVNKKALLVGETPQQVTIRRTRSAPTRIKTKPKSDCNCVDCGGTAAHHDPTCSYMQEIAGTQNHE